ncbi:MAG: hypothetical protein A2744_04660 [Candidatus Buchananbacteria bacterium RIFCSPHIGHO2_01_FULL_44_11]|uniref:Uncharacterized protein n=1 Tax=Candidatus Buchananbacteria bacterium RIFCSPHIGHO2_01_FULL_44_11 TaxID=1797535 RepID=A0A1G1Y1P9_9BACT|nr:MAG: hypothetical protein A2744_04660 [Candidatus Buchananbacteria bacterium RIFCSPHIGHO2_01_FULL_44_11]
MNYFVKITSIFLLTITVFFIFGSVLLITLLPQSHNIVHDGCFGTECGPVQHMLHSYIITNELSLADPAINKKIDSFVKELPYDVILTPDSPPPKFSLV